MSIKLSSTYNVILITKDGLNKSNNYKSYAETTKQIGLLLQLKNVIEDINEIKNQQKKDKDGKGYGPLYCTYNSLRAFIPSLQENSNNKIETLQIQKIEACYDDDVFIGSNKENQDYIINGEVIEATIAKEKAPIDLAF